MKTFSVLTLFASLLIFSSTLYAQQFYIDFNVGYAFPMNSQIGFLQNSSISRSEDLNTKVVHQTYQSENIPLSLGKGITFSGAIGYSFNKHITIEMGGSYLLGFKTTGTSKYYSSTVLYNGNLEIEKYETTQSYSSNMFRFIPAIVINSGFEKINPYARFGFIMGFGSIKENYEYESNINSPVSKIKEYNGGMGFGFTGGLGVAFQVTEKVFLFSEASITSFSYAPKKSEITKLWIGGKSRLADFSNSQKQTEYVKQLEVISGTNVSKPPSNNPSQAAKIWFPYNSFGLNFGVRFKL